MVSVRSLGPIPTRSQPSAIDNRDSYWPRSTPEDSVKSVCRSGFNARDDMTAVKIGGIVIQSADGE
jgi:hypothetical protein